MGGDWDSYGMPGQVVSDYATSVSGEVGCEGMVSVGLDWGI